MHSVHSLSINRDHSHNCISFKNNINHCSYTYQNIKWDNNSTDKEEIKTQRECKYRPT